DAERLVANMLASMKHRGPDHTEVMKVADDVFLGHNRLSIIDLQAVANQPFVSDDGRFTIVFNGEIYNYVELRTTLQPHFTFRTCSDTEVLLAAYRKWGKNCVERFIGMFAFAIWDNRENVLFAARDRFGVKPFYFHTAGNALLFSSEIKALWHAGVHRKPELATWSAFFVYGSYGMPHETFWEDIHQLPGGHYLIWQADKLVVNRWYFFEDTVKNMQPALRLLNEEQITEQYFALLQESIRLRFRADVPVGFNVSGGLDSSLLLSLIKKSFPENPTIQAFTFYTGNTAYDELPWVKELMNTTLYPLHAVQLKANGVPPLAETVARMQDEPYGGLPTLAYATLFKAARNHNTIVLLDGQGMDEAWAGYDYYQSNSGSIVQGVSSSPLRPNVLTEDFKKMADSPKYATPFSENLLNLQYRDLFYTKIPRALRFNDRVSMTYSTELREPFLDHRLVEMAFALPVEWKIKDGVGKYLLRKIAHQLLPDTIRLAPKRPLQTPQREWLSHELIDWAEDCITDFAKQPWVDKKELMREWDAFKAGNNDSSFHIWQWINSALLQP
ncbi:MAG TPA: asparagine synthase (glutamine-hydrolyzing), partial [Cyclobacteriaceae bacterium]|nr:asparagine synthase (glutamine-hydrolyzing) [Cyclobacteriaceae bacterium]